MLSCKLHFWRLYIKPASDHSRETNSRTGSLKLKAGGWGVGGRDETRRDDTEAPFLWGLGEKSIAIKVSGLTRFPGFPSMFSSSQPESETSPFRILVNFPCGESYTLAFPSKLSRLLTTPHPRFKKEEEFQMMDSAQWQGKLFLTAVSIDSQTL